MKTSKGMLKSGLHGRHVQGPGRAGRKFRPFRDALGASQSQAELLTSPPKGATAPRGPPTHQVDLTPLFQEYEPKPRAPLPSFDPLFKVFLGEDIENDPKREVIRDFIGLGETEPRIVSPTLPRPAGAPPPESLPLLYYLPGIDGTGLAAYRQFPLLAKAFDLRALVLPPDSRSSFQHIADVVQEHIRSEVARSPPSRPVYLLGESFGGLMCLALAARCRDVVDRVVMVNPASSFDRTPWPGMGGLLTVLPNEVYRLLPFALAPVLTNPFSLAMHDVDTKGSPLEQASDFAFGLVGLLPELGHLKLALPPETLSWRLNLLSQGCRETAPLIKKIPQRVLILAGQLDLLIPSVEEGQRLQKLLPRATLKVLEGRTHALLQEAGVDLLAIMEDEGFYTRTRRLSSDPIPAPFTSSSNSDPGPSNRDSFPPAPPLNGSSYSVASSTTAKHSTAVSSTSSSSPIIPSSSSFTATSSGSSSPSTNGVRNTSDSPQNGANGTGLVNGATYSSASALSPANSSTAPSASTQSLSEPDTISGGDSSGDESDSELSVSAVNTVTSVTIASRSGITSLETSIADVLVQNEGGMWEGEATELNLDNGQGPPTPTLPLSPPSSSLTTDPSRQKKKKTKRKSSTNYGAAGPVEVPTAREVELVFERTGFGVFKNVVSPVYLSTHADGRVEFGLGAIPSSRPLLFVGNHQLLDPSLPLMIEEFLNQRGILLRGLAHPAISKARTEEVAIDSGYMNMALRAMAERQGRQGTGVPGIVDFMTTWGAVPVGPKNFYALLQQGEAVLLYPGGVREAYKLKNERYKLIWPERSEFVRMAARLGATIVPFAAIGAEDGVTQLLDSREVSELPLLGPWLVEQARKLPSARRGVNEDAELEDLFVQPVLLPGLPSRYYYKFCAPIMTAPEMADDKEQCEELYRQVRKEVDGGLGWLLRKREADPYKELLPRLAFELTHPGERAPTFKLDG